MAMLSDDPADYITTPSSGSTVTVHDKAGELVGWIDVDRTGKKPAWTMRTLVDLRPGVPRPGPAATTEAALRVWLQWSRRARHEAHD